MSCSEIELPSAIVIATAEIIGDVTLGHGTVVHPFGKIAALNGPIEIGEENVIEEYAEIINDRPEKMQIGNCNVFSVKSKCEALKIGNRNILDAKAEIGPNVELTDQCLIGVNVKINTSETLPPCTVVTKNIENRIDGGGMGHIQESQLPRLIKMLPQYHVVQENVCKSPPK